MVDKLPNELSAGGGSAQPGGGGAAGCSPGSGSGSGSASPRVVLTIAGFDPSSGAGVTADLKTIAAHGLYGVACITALTVQSTQGVRRTEPVSAELVRDTLACLAEDVELSAIKIGMLGTAGVVLAVAAFLRGLKQKQNWCKVSRCRQVAFSSRKSHLAPFQAHHENSAFALGQTVSGAVPVVLDPVLRSSSGRELLDAAGLAAMRKELLGLVDWVTPNTDELAALTGMAVGDRVTREQIAQGVIELQRSVEAQTGRRLNLVVTGGDLEQPDDYLLPASGAGLWLAGERVETTSTHGTGCAFSSALACQLALGNGPAASAQAAKAYVTGALRAAYPVGKGRGPMNHLWRE